MPTDEVSNVETQSAPAPEVSSPHESTNTPENTQPVESATNETPVADGELELTPVGELKFSETLPDSLKALKHLSAEIKDGVIDIKAKVLDIIQLIIETTPSKKDDKIYKYVDSFLGMGASFLAFTKTIPEINGSVSIEKDGNFHFHCTLPERLSPLKQVHVVLKDGVIKSNINVLNLLKAITDATPTNKDNVAYPMVEGFLKLAIKNFAFKKKIT